MSANILEYRGKHPRRYPIFTIFNMVEENLDASIEASMFGDDEYPVETNDEYSLANILDEESDHALFFIHNHTLFQKGSINPNWNLLDKGSYNDVFCNPNLLNNIHS